MFTIHLAKPKSITLADPADCASKYLRITHPRSVADSTDGGFSFGAAYQQHDLPEPTGGCQASSIVVDGHVLFAAPASGDEGRENLTLRRSDDGGRSYPHTRQIMAGPGGYSCLTRLPNATHPGSVGLAYESGASGCTGGSCRILFQPIPMLFETEPARRAKADDSEAAAGAKPDVLFLLAGERHASPLSAFPPRTLTAAVLVR